MQMTQKPTSENFTIEIDYAEIKSMFSLSSIIGIIDQNIKYI